MKFLFFLFTLIVCSFSHARAALSTPELVRNFFSPTTDILMIGETHTDHMSRQYYASIIESVFKDVKGGCLFLEVDLPLQNQLDQLNKKSDPYLSSVEFYEAAYKYEHPNAKVIPATQERLLIFNSWVIAAIWAKKFKMKVFAIDDGLAYLESNEAFPKSEFIRRNQLMAGEIEKHFQNGDCKKAIALNGMAHLFMESKEISSIPTLLNAKGLVTQSLYMFSNSEFFNFHVGLQGYFPRGSNMIRLGKRFQNQYLFEPAMLRYVNNPDYWTPYHGTNEDAFLLNF